MQVGGHWSAIWRLSGLGIVHRTDHKGFDIDLWNRSLIRCVQGLINIHEAI